MLYYRMKMIFIGGDMQVTKINSELLEEIRNGKTLILSNHYGQLKCYLIWGPFTNKLVQESLFYFDNYNFRFFDDDEEVINYLKDVCKNAIGLE